MGMDDMGYARNKWLQGHWPMQVPSPGPSPNAVRATIQQASDRGVKAGNAILSFLFWGSFAFLITWPRVP